MWELTEKYSGSRQADASLFLPFEMRQRSRLKVKLDNGEPASIILSRGGILRDGDLLLSKCGKIVIVKAAKESVTTISEDDPFINKSCLSFGESSRGAADRRRFFTLPA